MKYLSLFSGIGGFEYGIDKAFQQEPIREGSVGECVERQGGISNDRSRRGESNSEKGHRVEQWVCIGYSEIDKYAIQVYEKHFKHKNYGDATKINPRELPDFDLLVGGFPCQAFSIAGKRKGFDDTRGTLFFDIARILAEKKPRLVVLENVKGLLSHEGGKTFQTIIGVLTDLGYFVEWQVLNSKNFGVPQNRERVFIIGYLGGETRRKVFPIRESGAESIKQMNNPIHSNNRVYGDEGVSPALNTMQGGNRQPKIAMRWIRTEKGREFRREAQKQGRDLTPFNYGYRELVESSENVSGCITNALQKDALLKDDMRIRRLTPTECERLQGFPDGWTEGLSDTQRYKCLGNAVTTNVVEYVFRKLLTTK